MLDPGGLSYSMLTSSLSMSRMGIWDLLSCQLKHIFQLSLSVDSSPEPNTPVISFALGSGTLYCLPSVVNGCHSVRQMFETPGLAKIDANFQNAAASGMFLEHLFLYRTEWWTLSKERSYCYWNKQIISTS